jgi:D-3-phosphoglycerate dehydrogenase / 2-oxoglutarate reductase
MTAPRKTVVRFDLWVHPDFVTRLQDQGDIDFILLQQDDEAAARAAFEKAHAYHIGAGKDDLQKRWWATDDLFAKAPNLLIVSSAGAGYDTSDLDACTRAGVLLCNQAGGNARSVAEHTLGLMLDLTKRITETDRKLRATRGYTREDLMGHELAGRTLGLIGIGNVGTIVAAMAKAFAMDVVATDPNVDADEVARRGARKVELDELLAVSDFVSVHCPKIPTTVGMIGENQFAAMKPGTIFITTARGGIHDEAALTAAMESGHVGGAGLDVWDAEPPPLDHPLLPRDNVVSTFHTAGVTHEARQRIAQFAADQIIDCLAGRRPPRILNPEAWPRFAERFEAIFGTRPT